MYAKSLLQAAREALASHGSVEAFLADEEASASAVQMYLADYLSLRLDVELHLADSEELFDLGACGPLQDVHLTDGVSTIVRCDMREVVTYGNCASFLANAIGYKDGDIASPWKRVIVAHDADAKVCPELSALFKRGPFEWKFNLQIVELYMLALLDVTSGDTVILLPDSP